MNWRKLPVALSREFVHHSELPVASDWRGPVTKTKLLVAALAIVTVTLTPIVSAIVTPSRASATVPSNWSVVSSPNVSGASESTLEGTSCVSASYCVSVGWSYSSSTGISQTLVESWNGTSWSIIASPDTSSTQSNSLSGVDCLSTSDCIAVGNGAGATLIEQWNGSSWSIISSSGLGTDDLLYSISCTSSSNCIAVGSYFPQNQYESTLIESWNGTSWSVTSSPNPQNSLASIVDGVSCTASNNCTAVGFYNATNGYFQTLIEYWNGSSWSVEPSPNIGVNVHNSLTSVDCTSSTYCIAVGSWQPTNNGGAETLSVSWNGASWSIDPSANTNSSNDNVLNVLSCISASSCVAVGDFAPNPVGSNPDTLIEDWNGLSWSIVTSPNPTTTGDTLSGVACTSALACVATGLSGSPVSGQTLVESTTTSLSVTPDGALPGANQWGGGGGAVASCDCSTGEPVNPATGDFYDTETDLTIPGVGIPLTFSRTYDAEAAQAEVAATAPAGPLGYGWTNSLGLSISYNSTANQATVTQANGSEILFQYYTTGMTEPVGSNGVTWCPSDASNGVYCPASPTELATLSGSAGGPGGPWTFVNGAKSPITYSFNTSGVLTEVADAQGDTLTSAAYSPGSGQSACPTGDTCTAWSSTPSGESSPSAVLVEAFNSSSQLVSVFDAASAASSTQVASFTYTGTGCSTWTGTPQDLCSVTDPGSLTTTFTYDTSKSSPYQYDEITVTPPATGAITNTYNATGQITKQVIATGGTNQEQDFSYGTNATVTNGTQTVVTSYPDGSGGPTTTTTYVYSNGVEVSQTDGTGVSTYSVRDPATLLGENKFDGNGNATNDVFQNYADPGGTATSSANVTLSTDNLGNTTQNAYTSSNLVWCTVDPANYANGTRCPSSIPSGPPAAGTHIGYTLTLYNTTNEVTSTTDPLGNTSINFIHVGSHERPERSPVLQR